MNHRTALIVAASLAAVVFGAAIAVAVNLGILTAADSSPVGRLTTATVARQTPLEPVAQYRPAAATTIDRRQTQTYAIKHAGTVRIAFSKTAVRFVSAAANRHWTWKLSQSADRSLTVTFEHGNDTYTFAAHVGKGGKVTAGVDHPVTRVVPSSGGGTTWTVAPASTPPAASAPAVSGGYHEGGNDGGQADD